MVKCIRYKKVRKRVCVDFAGGKGKGGKGKRCIRYKYATVKVCADFGKKGHGKLSKEQREKIRQSIHAGAFGGKGTFKSLAKCKIEVDRQKARGVPYAIVSKRINLIRIFRKNQPNGVKRVADECLKYAKEVYGRK